jgi:hypothetical protein
MLISDLLVIHSAAESANRSAFNTHQSTTTHLSTIRNHQSMWKQ